MINAVAARSPSAGLSNRFRLPIKRTGIQQRAGALEYFECRLRILRQWPRGTDSMPTEAWNAVAGLPSPGFPFPVRLCQPDAQGSPYRSVRLVFVERDRHA